jgi:hypothetical protein
MCIPGYSLQRHTLHQPNLVSVSWQLFCSAPLPRTLTAKRLALDASQVSQSHGVACRAHPTEPGLDLDGAHQQLEGRQAAEPEHELPIKKISTFSVRTLSRRRKSQEPKQPTESHLLPSPGRRRSRCPEPSASPARAAMPAWAEAAFVLASPSPASSTTSSCGVRPRAAVESGRLFCKVAPPISYSVRRAASEAGGRTGAL